MSTISVHVRVQAARAHDLMCLRCKPDDGGGGGEPHGQGVINFPGAYGELLPLLPQLTQVRGAMGVRATSLWITA